MSERIDREHLSASQPALLGMLKYREHAVLARRHGAASHIPAMTAGSAGRKSESSYQLLGSARLAHLLAKTRVLLQRAPLGRTTPKHPSVVSESGHMSAS